MHAVHTEFHENRSTDAYNNDIRGRHVEPAERVSKKNAEICHFHVTTRRSCENISIWDSGAKDKTNENSADCCVGRVSNG